MSHRPYVAFRYIGSMQSTQKRRSTTSPKNKAKVLKSRVTYRAPVFYVASEIVKEPSGVTARRDIVRHPGSVVVLAVDDAKRSEPRVLLARQFRYAAGREMWELPAGRIDPGESALEGGKRELIEETGYRAKKWSKALFFYVSPGFLDETMTIYLAEGLERGEASPEEDEVIRARMLPLATAVTMVMKGKILDAKTIAGLLWFNQKRLRS